VQHVPFVWFVENSSMNQSTCWYPYMKYDSKKQSDTFARVLFSGTQISKMITIYIKPNARDGSYYYEVSRTTGPFG